MTVPVRVDPRRPAKVAIDSSGNFNDAGATGAGLPRTTRAITAADIVRDGIPATSRPVECGGPAGGDDHGRHGFGRGTFGAQGIHRVPKDRLDRLTMGATLPVAYLTADPANTTCVDWDRL